MADDGDVNDQEQDAGVPDVDLDAARERRKLAEADATTTEPQRGPVIRFGGETFQLPPPPIPVRVLFAYGALEENRVIGIREYVEALFPDVRPTDEDGRPLVGEDGRLVPSPFERFMAHDPDEEDVAELVRQVAKAYRESAGNSRGSRGSSTGTGTKPKRTSKTTTG